jgi:hypothetical protein
MNPAPTESVVRAVRQARLLWAAHILGLLCLAIGLQWIGVGRQDPALAAWVAWSAVVGSIITIPLGLFFRGEQFKKHWRGPRVEPAGYLHGNLLAWAGCGVPAGIGLIGCALASSYWPYGLAVLLPAAMFAVLWPDGRIMRAGELAQ